MAPFLHCFRCGVFNVPWQPRRYLCLVPHSGSVPPSGCSSVQAKPTISCVMKSGIASSPPLVLPTSPETAHRSCPMCFTAVLLEPPDTQQHSTGLCGVLSAWNSLCPMSTGQTRTCTHPTPSWPSSCFHLTEVSVGVIFNC